MCTWWCFEVRTSEAPTLHPSSLKNVMHPDLTGGISGILRRWYSIQQLTASPPNKATISIKPPLSEQIFTLLAAALWDEFWWREENVGNKRRRALKSYISYWKISPAGGIWEERSGGRWRGGAGLWSIDTISRVLLWGGYTFIILLVFIDVILVFVLVMMATTVGSGFDLI